MKTAIALFTRDLRVHDNPVLNAAAKSERVVPLFVLDPAFDHVQEGSRRRFLADALHDLDHMLNERGSRLIIRRGDTVEETCRLAAEVDASEVHIAADVTEFARERVRRLHSALTCRFVEHEAVHTVVPMGHLHPEGRDHYAVFTPYWRKWADTPVRSVLRPPSKLDTPDVHSFGLPKVREPIGGGESTGRRRMSKWLRDGVHDYTDQRDILAVDGTSQLSPYLHFGCVSALELTVRAREVGAEDFARQLAWRDFHHQVLAHNPKLTKTDYRPAHRDWADDADVRAAWAAGMTGYPLVDAGMRQLTATGWMHNRARMLVGSFLTKTLGEDWRFGADVFARQLVDADVANNIMNWQWVAGTGTDTRPARRLSPIRQAERFDPDAAYIQRWVPELSSLPAKYARMPWTLAGAHRKAIDYPNPIVDPPESAR
ncbi:MAG: DNA photolyase family protein [Nocardiaceae bacterium]|nr:DNA photolyase family protein [Nocardiaceae bacterium]